MVKNKNKTGGCLLVAKKITERYRTRNLQVSREFYTFTKTKTMEGLRIQNGRLINDRPDSITGLQRMAQMKKAMKRQEKISIMVDAMRRKDMLDDIRSLSK